jgi:hypothetical protein
MIKRIHLFCFIVLNAAGFSSYAQNSETVSAAQVNGYYQRINLDDESACNCKEKTDRTYELSKGLRPGEVTKYQLHAYRFQLGNSTLPVSKLFKAFESDNSIYKISVQEWNAMLLLTTASFDKASFETAAAGVFSTFTVMDVAEFLKMKNSESYAEYLNALRKETNNPNEIEIQNETR